MRKMGSCIGFSVRSIPNDDEPTTQETVGGPRASTSSPSRGSEGRPAGDRRPRSGRLTVCVSSQASGGGGCKRKNAHKPYPNPICSDYDGRCILKLLACCARRVYPAHWHCILNFWPGQQQQKPDPKKLGMHSFSCQDESTACTRILHSLHRDTGFAREVQHRGVQGIPGKA